MKETMLMKEVWVPANEEFRFAESIEDGEKRFILSGMMLPFNTVSRNSVLYNEESVRDKCEQLVGKPLMYNHKIEGDELPKGHFIKSWCENDGWYYKADVDPAEKEFIRKLNRKDLRHVSIQLVGGKVVERESKEDGKNYTEAWVEDVIEGSVVPAPGFLDTTAKFAEAFKEEEKNNKVKVHIKRNDLEKNGEKKVEHVDPDTGYFTGTDGNKYAVEARLVAIEEKEEQMDTTTAGGAIAPELMLKKKKECGNCLSAKELEEINEFINESKEEELDNLL